MLAAKEKVKELGAEAKRQAQDYKDMKKQYKKLQEERQANKSNWVSGKAVLTVNPAMMKGWRDTPISLDGSNKSFAKRPEQSGAAVIKKKTQKSMKKATDLLMNMEGLMNDKTTLKLNPAKMKGWR